MAAAPHAPAPEETTAPPSILQMERAMRRGELIIRGRQHSARDVYHWLLTVSWPTFALVGFLAYMAANAGFAFLYLADPKGVSGAHAGSFPDAFFFSVETIGTIGYGAMFPRDLYANLVMTGENFFGLSFIAVATGVIFARVSRPTARVMFSRHAVVVPFDGVPTLMFRAANQRANRVIQADASVTVLHEVTTPEGHHMRRFEDLALVRARTPMFALSWTIMHRLDETSPLYGMSPEALSREGAEIIVMLSGVDETFAQRIHARHAYPAGDIVWNRRMVDVLMMEKSGRRIVDYSRFHDLEPLKDEGEGAAPPPWTEADQDEVEAEGAAVKERVE